MRLRLSSTDKRTSIPPVTMVGTGLVLIACSLIWPRLTALHGSMSSSSADFFQGFLGGIGIACEVVGIGSMLSGRNRKNENSSVIPRQ
jgi:hypothetical protein